MHFIILCLQHNDSKHYLQRSPYGYNFYEINFNYENTSLTKRLFSCYVFMYHLCILKYPSTLTTTFFCIQEKCWLKPQRACNCVDRLAAANFSFLLFRRKNNVILISIREHGSKKRLRFLNYRRPPYRMFAGRLTATDDGERR